MGAGAGLEPAATADEAAMLPLHHPAIGPRATGQSEEKKIGKLVFDENVE